ncbi:DUF2971 domain-containing protein [Pseudoalteromonas sp. 1_2015MBL_MicDiv]|uniref:DUF2971 domain-containing protein n=1 Tax=Pseudoalteromonas sp. 1_2015MBL_MicDiv TaxID=1720343 RepID=UPI000BBECE91|nr:DUF2971 domain-containing protein [Pseudoalteromonas sp. 1_2015MBL_MicDiv]ATG79384.1 hypothetical protein AOR04_17630 [Pseudoalteromonas sp. 1_2015MBL_MicDiv]
MNLYQYTDINAVKSILRTQELWATHYQYLNDTSEIEQGIELILNRLAESKKLSIEKIQDLKQQVMHSLSKLDIFIVSLCLAKDELSMWREYGPYAIELDNNAITLSLTVSGPFTQSDVRPCLYPVQLRKSDSFIDFEFISTLYDECYLKGDRVRFISSLVYSAAAIKHAAFYAEKEKRAIFSLDKHHTTEIFHRECNGKKVPYIKVLLPKSSIKAVYIGPQSEQAQLVTDMRDFLKSNKLTGIKVYSSDIPYKPK